MHARVVSKQFVSDERHTTTGLAAAVFIVYDCTCFWLYRGATSGLVAFPVAIKHCCCALLCLKQPADIQKDMHNYNSACGFLIKLECIIHYTGNKIVCIQSSVFVL